jgi:hypothetical protein
MMPRAGSAFLLLLAAGPAVPSEFPDAKSPLAAAQAEAEPQAVLAYVPGRPTPMEIRTDGPSVSLPQGAGCLLTREATSGAPASRCLGCHGGSIREHASHPVDVDYEGSPGQATGVLRTLREAIARGAFLPDGKVRCTSCHDGRSRFRYRLAIPPGSEIRPAIRLDDPRTFEPAAGPGGGLAALLADRPKVAARPLCLSCHPMD